MAKEYYLSFSFSANENMWDVQDEVEKLLGRSHGSGCGMGIRDLSYTYNNLNSVKAAVRKVRALPRRIKCVAWDTTTDDWGSVSLKGVK